MKNNALLRVIKSNDFWVAILVFGVAISFSFVAIKKERGQGTQPFFYQSYFEPAIRLTCGQPFGVDLTGQLSQEMLDFLKIKRDTLACDQVFPAKDLDANPPSRAWYHLFLTTAAMWKVTGISWSAMNGLAAVLFSLAALMVYAMFRLWMPVSVAGVLAVVSILPGHEYLLYLRDLNKAPFILAALFVAAWLATQGMTRRRYYLIMIVIGAWLGFGYGFRPDVLISLPLLAITALFFRPLTIKRGWMDGLAGTVIMLLAFAAVASPMLSAFVGNVGTCTWHFALLGLSDSHTKLLGLPDAAYSWLTHYDDHLTARTVESYAERVLSMPPVGYCTAAYDRASRALYLDTILAFPGDFLDRALAAAKYVTGFGFAAFFDKTLGRLSPVGNISIIAWFITIYSVLVKNVRLGLFALFGLAYVCAYPVVQFEPRHFFYLAFLAWLPVGIFLPFLPGFFRAFRSHNFGAWVASFDPPQLHVWVRAIVVMAATAMLAMAIVVAARHYQGIQTRQLFEQYLAAQGDAIEQRIEYANTGELRIILPEPFGAVSESKKVNARMLRIDVGGKSCPPGRKQLSLVLGGSEPSYDLKKDFVVDVGAGQPVAIFAFTAFEYPQLTTLSLVFPEGNKECIVGTQWLHPDTLPSLWVTAVVHPE